MNVSAPFIARPIATALLAVAVLISGILGYMELPVSSLPEVEFPTILVTTQLPGAGPSTIANLITAPLERQLGEIQGVVGMTSTSAQGLSQIVMQFSLDRDIDDAAQDVQAAINASAGTLPTSLPYPPVYAKVNPADTPIVTLAMTSKSVPLYTMADEAVTLLQPKLSQISGIGQVTVLGGLRQAYRIQADPARLAAYSLSLEDIRNAVADGNQNGSKGGFDGPTQSFTLGANDQLETADSYANLVVAWRNSAPVRVRDVARVVTAMENDATDVRFNGRSAVVLSIQREPGANIVATADLVKKALPKLERTLPGAVQLTLVSDRTTTIRASVNDVQFTLLLSILLVVLVIYLFLGSIRATIIPGLALPLSLIGTFGIMYFLGYGLDNLSLMALTVAAGFVVDDAIVMIENVVRFIEDGVPPLEAAYRGARQIGFTIISLTISLIAVFIPLLFMSGVVGKLFHEFAVTLSVAVIVSAVISLTLTPMMCGRLLRPVSAERPGWPARVAEAGFTRLLGLYRVTLIWVLRRQPLVLLISVATLVGTILLYVVVPKGFLPQQDTGSVIAITEASQDISIPAMIALQNQAAAAFRTVPGVTNVVSDVGTGTENATPNSGQITISLAPDRSAPRRDADRRRTARGHGQHPRPHDLLSAGAGHPARHQHHPHRLPISADRYGCERAGRLRAVKLVAKLADAAAARPCQQRPAEQRRRHLDPRRPGRGHAPRRADADGREHPRRRLRPASDLDHLRPDQPVSRHPRARSTLRPEPGPGSTCSISRQCRQQQRLELEHHERQQHQQHDLGQRHLGRLGQFQHADGDDHGLHRHLLQHLGPDPADRLRHGDTGHDAALHHA